MAGSASSPTPPGALPGPAAPRTAPPPPGYPQPYPLTSKQLLSQHCLLELCKLRGRAVLGLSTSGLSPREKPCFDLGNWMHLVWNSLTPNRDGNHTPSRLLSWQSLTALSGPVPAELERTKPSKLSSCRRQTTLPWANCLPGPLRAAGTPRPPAGKLEVISTCGWKRGSKAPFRSFRAGRDASSVLIHPTYSGSYSLWQVSVLPMTATEQPAPPLPLPAAEPGRLQEQP